MHGNSPGLQTVRPLLMAAGVCAPDLV